MVLEYVPSSDLQNLLENATLGVLTESIPHPDLPDTALIPAGQDFVLLSDPNGDTVEIDVNGVTFTVPSRCVKITNTPLDDADIPWRLRLRICLDIAKGVQYLHSLIPPVVHRDLRSPNVFLVTTDPNAPVVAKVADLGMAVFSHNKMRRQLATWQWLAPEVINLTRIGYDIRSDIYSFAIVMYEVLTRNFPFIADYAHRFRRKNGIDQHAFIHAIVTENLRPIVDPLSPYPYCPSPDGWSQYCRLMSDCWAAAAGM